jgi:Ni/Co efflux regulator RcnB
MKVAIYLNSRLGAIWGAAETKGEAMKKALLTGALVAAMLAPVAAQAQDHREDRHERDHADMRHDRGEMHGDHRDFRGDRHDFRGDRGDFRGDRQGFRHDRREAWQDNRGIHPDYYRRGNWNAPFRYRSFAIGGVVPGSYWGSRYYVNDWQRFRLPRPQYGFYRYVRHYDDILLINTRSGRVVRVYRGFYR